MAVLLKNCKQALSTRTFRIILPMFFCCFGMWFQLVMEHYATYKYMHRYAMTDEEVDHNFTTMFDPVQVHFEYKQVSLKIVDAAGYVPAFVFLFVTIGFLVSENTYGSKDKYHEDKIGVILSTWTKVLSMWSVLAILKGILDAVTLQPDSADYEVCKDRIHDWGVWWMRQEHQFWEFMILDFCFYFWTGGKYTPPMRLCCDMMYSGHTFTVVIFALGSYELARISAMIMPPDKFKCFKKKDGSPQDAKIWKKWVNIVAISTIIAFSIVEQVYEIYVVEESHFHYTVDVVVAVAMSFLVWTNCVIPYWAKKWGTNGLLAFCSPEEEIPTSAKASLDKPLTGPKKKARTSDNPGEYLDSSGDVLIPICAAPFCCMCWPGPSEEGDLEKGCQWEFTLRQHLYKDIQLRALIRHSCPTKDMTKGELDQMLESVERQMTMDESFNHSDCCRFLKCEEAFDMSYRDDDHFLRLYMRVRSRQWEEGEYTVEDKNRNEVKVRKDAGGHGELIDKDGNPFTHSDNHRDHYPLTVRKKPKKHSRKPSSGDDIKARVKKTCGDLRKELPQRGLQLFLFQIVIPVLVLWVFVWKLCHVCWAFATWNYVHHYGMHPLGEDYFKDHRNQKDPTVLTDPFRNIFQVGAGIEQIPVSKGFEIFGEGWQRTLVHSPEMLFFLTFLILLLFKQTRQSALQVFQKVLFALLLLLPFTAMLCLLTSVPDASGWQGCQDKLKATKCPHNEVRGQCGQDGSFFSFFKEYQSFWSIFKFGVFNGRFEYGGGVCGISFSDYLGATVVETLGLFELSLFLCRQYSWHRTVLIAIVTLYGLAIIGVIIILYEVDHIHYTMDWIMSVSLGFLFYTNGGVAMFAKKYSKLGKDKIGDIKEEKDAYDKYKHILSSGDILIPPCCVPFCCLWGRYHIFQDEDVEEIVKKIKELNERGKGLCPEEWKDYEPTLRVKMNMDEGVKLADFGLAPSPTSKSQQSTGWFPCCDRRRSVP